MADEKIDLDERRIQEKAYELWELRGCPAGDPERDWHEAVALLTRAAKAKVETSPQHAITNDMTGSARRAAGSGWSFPFHSRS
jgi:hypothetical protein